LRNQDFRHSRRRDFDTDTHHPQSRAFSTQPRFAQTGFDVPSGPSVRAVVKWFSPEKGFGFVELSDESGDGFLHGSVLARTGISAVAPGDTLEVRVGPGHTGPHVTEVLSLHSSIVAPAAQRRSSTSSDSPLPDTGVEETGTVKWFNSEKGYGFIARDSGGKDVFLHISALERSGIATLGEGQRVIVDVVEGRKGLEAERVRLA
jgi:CspA family cold shock protein